MISIIHIFLETSEVAEPWNKCWVFKRSVIHEFCIIRWLLRKSVFMHKFCEYFYAEYMCRNGKVGFGFFFLHFSNRSNHVGKRSKFYTRKFEATKRSIGKCNVWVYSMLTHTGILCTAYSVCTEDNLGVDLERVRLTRNASWVGRELAWPAWSREVHPHRGMNCVWPHTCDPPT